MARITEMPRGITPVWIHDLTHLYGTMMHDEELPQEVQAALRKSGK
jgi:hypothetical protein